MGTILLILGLIPGLLDRMIQGLIDAGAATRFPFPRPVRVRLSRIVQYRLRSRIGDG